MIVVYYSVVVSISKVERLLNLVIALLSTRQFLSAERIRSTVAGYAESVSDEAFSRMFERDKSELRDLGIPLEIGQVGGYGTGEGYRIDRAAYELPDIDLTSGETAAVAVAVQLWESPELSAAAAGAVMKLRAAGIEVDGETVPVVPVPVPSRSRGDEVVLRQLLAALAEGRAVRFAHHTATTEPYRVRDVEPWGVVTHRGRWYLVGHDRDKDATRTFRLSRIGDQVTAHGPAGVVHKPAEVDLRVVVAQATSNTPVTGNASIWVAAGRAGQLRRMGTVVGQRTVADRAGDVVRVSVRSPEWLARLISGFGPDAVVLEPVSLRQRVIGRLRSLCAETDSAAKKLAV